MIKAEKTDPYIPLKARFMAWWEGVEPDAMVESDALQSAADGVVPLVAPEQAASDPSQIEVDVPVGPAPVWSEERIAFYRRLWGNDDQDDAIVPGGIDLPLRLVKPMALTNHMQMLDVGCGIGGAARAVAEHIGPRITGVVDHQELIDLGNELTAAARLQKQVSLELTDYSELDFGKSKYEGALVREIAYRQPDRLDFLRAVKNAIKPQGHIVLTDLVLATSDARDAKPIRRWLEKESAGAEPGVLADY